MQVLPPVHNSPRGIISLLFLAVKGKSMMWIWLLHAQLLTLLRQWSGPRFP